MNNAVKEKLVSERTVKHSTIVVERNFKASPSRVFAAWADPNAHGRWNVPGDDWEIAEYENDFRVGGHEKNRFGPKGDPKYYEEGRYLDIVPDARIVSAGAMHFGNIRTSATLCTIELLPNGTGTRLILTDQSVYFNDRETPADRKTGWGEVLDRLETKMGRADVTV
jgi:uncharacterized protein YndB with AHSA1/START domain